MPTDVHSIQWEEVFNNWKLGLAWDELATLHKINPDLIKKRAEEYGWDTLGATEVPTLALKSAESAIKAGRDRALRNCERLEEVIEQSLNTLSTKLTPKQNDIKDLRARVDIAHKLAELAHKVNDLRQRSLGDTKDLAPIQSESNSINIILPSIMALPRTNPVVESEVIEGEFKSNADGE